MKGRFININNLACDYDGTLAEKGVMSYEVFECLLNFKKNCGKLLMVTGRELEELFEVCPYTGIFDIIVAENGALLYSPSYKSINTLSEPPPEKFITEAEKRGVKKYSTGRVVYAAWRPAEKILLPLIKELNLNYHLIFNKDALMMLPAGIDKAYGLKKAMDALRILPGETAAVGDAENDISMFKLCGFSAAVKNSVDELKKAASVLLSNSHGRGVCELINKLLLLRE